MHGSSIRLEAITKAYGNVEALGQTDLSINAGEFFTLLGPSGSGKTTILNLIAGTIAPTSGSIWLGDRDITDEPSSAREMGMVFQNYALMPHMTIFDNVAFPLRVRRMSRADICRKVEEALRVVQLPQMSARYPKELSGGQQQRVALARSIVYDPNVILMDEPLSALDRKLREQMQVEIKQLHSILKVTIIYVTHDQGEALTLSDRICLMNAGKVEQIGTPRQLYFEPASYFAADFLGESNILEATVEPQSRFRLTNGTTIAAENARPLPIGAKVRIMVRPECISTDSSGPDIHTNCRMDGLMHGASLIGGVTELRIRMSDDQVLAARRLTRRCDQTPELGEPVSLYFRPDDVVVLS